MPTLREYSKNHNFTPTSVNGPTVEEINTGSLQRIADAAEKMAKNYTDLQDELEKMTKSKNYWRDQAEYKTRQIFALKGHITRLKKRLL